MSQPESLTQPVDDDEQMSLHQPADLPFDVQSSVRMQEPSVSDDHQAAEIARLQRLLAERPVVPTFPIETTISHSVQIPDGDTYCILDDLIPSTYTEYLSDSKYVCEVDLAVASSAPFRLDIVCGGDQKVPSFFSSPSKRMSGVSKTLGADNFVAQLPLKGAQLASCRVYVLFALPPELQRDRRIGVVYSSKSTVRAASAPRAPALPAHTGPTLRSSRVKTAAKEVTSRRSKKASTPDTKKKSSRGGKLTDALDGMVVPKWLLEPKFESEKPSPKIQRKVKKMIRSATQP
jgi:hypothetical protein